MLLSGINLASLAPDLITAGQPVCEKGFNIRGEFVRWEVRSARCRFAVVRFPDGELTMAPSALVTSVMA